jgi:hypothetical protein
MAYRLLESMHALGDHHALEDVVWNAWDAILGLYFDRTLGNVRFLIAREAYRGRWISSSRWPGLPVRPDLVVVRLIAAPQDPNLPPNQPRPRLRGRDYLWVECKPPTHDIPSGWRAAIDETSSKLTASHANPPRPVAVIIAIGLKCLWLLWDPAHTLQLPQAPGRVVRILGSNPLSRWEMHTSLEALPDTPGHNPVTGEIDTRRAVHLTAWDSSPGSRQGLEQLEFFLHRVRNARWELSGMNPDHWAT